MLKQNKNKTLAIRKPLTNDVLWFKKSIDRQFENFFSGQPFSLNLPLQIGKPAWWNPEIDVYETSRNVIVEADLPGLERKDVKVEIDNNILTISGEKKGEKETKKKNFYQKEQHAGLFFRRVGLPDYADVNKPKAVYENGVLKIAFPKAGLVHPTHKLIPIGTKEIRH